MQRLLEEKMLKNFLKNKWVSMAVNIGYMVGWVWSIEGGFVIKYLLISTAIMLVLFWKPLVAVMKAGGDMYAGFCRKQSYKLTKRVYKGYTDPEREELLKK